MKLNLSNFTLVSFGRRGKKALRFDLSVSWPGDSGKNFAFTLSGCRAYVNQTDNKVVWSGPLVGSGGPRFSCVWVSEHLYDTVLRAIISQRRWIRMIEPTLSEAIQRLTGEINIEATDSGQDEPSAPGDDKGPAPAAGGGVEDLFAHDDGD